MDITLIAFLILVVVLVVFFFTSTDTLAAPAIVTPHDVPQTDPVIATVTPVGRPIVDPVVEQSARDKPLPTVVVGA